MDHDGYGDLATSMAVSASELATGGCSGWEDGTHPKGFWVAVGGDCEDEDPTINPSATEVAGNDRDEDCNGAVGCWVDQDNDNYARDDAALADAPSGLDCAQAEELAGRRGDCDDDPMGCGVLCSPVAIELCDELDNDCDLKVDEAGVCDAPLVGVLGGGEGCFSGGASILAALLFALALTRPRTTTRRSPPRHHFGAGVGAGVTLVSVRRT